MAFVECAVDPLSSLLAAAEPPLGMPAEEPPPTSAAEPPNSAAPPPEAVEQVPPTDRIQKASSLESSYLPSPYSPNSFRRPTRFVFAAHIAAAMS